MNVEYVKTLFNLFYGSESSEGYGIHIADAIKFVKSIAKDDNSDDIRLCYLAAAIAVKDVRKTRETVLHSEDPLLGFFIQLVDSYVDMCRGLIDAKMYTKMHTRMSEGVIDDHIYFWVRAADTKINECHEQITEQLLNQMKTDCIGKSVKFDIPGVDKILESGTKIVDSMITHDKNCDILYIKVRIPRICITETFCDHFSSHTSKPVAHIAYYCPNQVCSICGRNFFDPNCNHENFDRLLLLNDPCEIFEITILYDE